MVFSRYWFVFPSRSLLARRSLKFLSLSSPLILSFESSFSFKLNNSFARDHRIGSLIRSLARYLFVLRFPFPPFVIPSRLSVCLPRAVLSLFLRSLDFSSHLASNCSITANSRLIKARLIYSARNPYRGGSRVFCASKVIEKSLLCCFTRVTEGRKKKQMNKSKSVSPDKWVDLPGIACEK